MSTVTPKPHSRQPNLNNHSATISTTFCYKDYTQPCIAHRCAHRGIFCAVVRPRIHSCLILPHDEATMERDPVSLELLSY
jgi:hypothetical protein